MVTSVTDICNRALSAVSGRSTISAITENTPAARQCLIWYDDVRQVVARAANWQFNKKYVTMALSKAAPGTPENPTGSSTSAWDPITQPPPPWLYAYQYPSDCIRARNVQGQFQVSAGFAIPIFSTSVGGLYPQRQGFAPFNEAVDDTVTTSNPSGADVKVILTNQTTAILCYTKDVLDPNIWDAGFVEAVIYGLAGRIAMGITGDKNGMVNMYKLANQALLNAQAQDANEQTTIDDHTPDWIAAREGLPLGGGYNAGWLMAPYGPLFSAINA